MFKAAFSPQFSPLTKKVAISIVFKDITMAEKTLPNLQAIAEHTDNLLSSFDVQNNWDLELRNGSSLGVFSFTENGLTVEVTGFSPEQSVRRVAVIGDNISSVLSYRRDSVTGVIDYAEVAEYDSPRFLEENMESTPAAARETTSGENQFRSRRPAATFDTRLQTVLSRDRENVA